MPVLGGTRRIGNNYQVYAHCPDCGLVVFVHRRTHCGSPGMPVSPCYTGLAPAPADPFPKGHNFSISGLTPGSPAAAYG